MGGISVCLPAMFDMLVHHSLGPGVGVPYVMLRSTFNNKYVCRRDSDSAGDPVTTRVSTPFNSMP